MFTWNEVVSAVGRFVVSLKFTLNSVVGGIIIFIINLIGGFWNFHIGLNIFTSIIVGILGVPGTILVIMIKLLIG